MIYINYLLDFTRVGYRGTHARRDEHRRHRSSATLQRAAGRLGIRLAGLAVGLTLRSAL